MLKARIATAFAVALLASILVLASAQAQTPPAHLDPINRSLWSDTDLGVRFTYPAVWELGRPTQDSTRVVLNWRPKKSKALLATCYVEVQTAPESQLARLRPDQIHGSAASIAQSILRNLRQRAPDAELLVSRSTVQDGHPVIYVVRKGTLETFDRKDVVKMYSLITAWRNREVNFECATSVIGAEYTALEGGPRLIKQVELGIENVMRTLQFDRAKPR